MTRESDFPPGRTAERAPPVSLDPGTVIDGRYRLLELIGEGGMGQVFEGEHLELRRKVAIKMLASHGRVDAQLVKRFEREAHTLAAVSHPNIVTVTDYGVFEGLPFLVMERLEGQSLAAMLEERGTLTLEHAAALMRQVLASLGHAHSRGLVHRDLKPGNVWVESHDDGEHVKLLDFGFAKFVESEGGTLLTADGIVVGTLAYMSPEQGAGGTIDHRSDIYAAGVLFFEMLTGRRPFEGEAIEVLRAHLTVEPPTLRAARPDRVFPPEVEVLVRRALEKKPAMRFESAADFARALQVATARDAEPETLVYDPPRSSVDEQARTLVHDEAKTVARAASPLPKRMSGSSKSEIELRTQDIEAIRPIVPSRKPVAPKPATPERPPKVRSARGRNVKAYVGAGLVLALVAGGAYATLRLAPWPFGADASAVRSEAELTTGSPAEGRADEAEAGPAEDPWELFPRNPRLDRYRAHVKRGGAFSRGTLRALRAYERERPEDPRVELLIALSFLNDRWFSDSLDRFAGAYAKDPRIAVSEDFLAGLVQLARYEATSGRAAMLIEEIYGARAVPAVEVALGEIDRDAAATARLQALLLRLEG